MAGTQELGKQNPQLFSLITQNQSEFMRLLSEPANAAPANSQAADLAAQLASAAGGKQSNSEYRQIRVYCTGSGT